MNIPTEELCDRYADLYTGAITDVLDEMGYGSRTLPSCINPIQTEKNMAGVAYPVHGYPDEDCDYEANMRRFLRMLGDAPSESVIAYQSRDEEAAHLGELSTTALQAQGCRGAVLDGGVRDIGHILEQEFPVFTKYRTPADAPPRWRLAEWDVPITIGPVEIRPGDILVGDVDGVVCVPKEIKAEVLDRAETTAQTENEVRSAIKNGVSPLDAYEQYGEF